MKTRIITGTFIGIILFCICWFSSTPVLPIVVGILSAVGVIEMLFCIGVKKKTILCIPAVLVSIGSTVFASVFDSIEQYALSYMGMMILFLLLIFASSIFSKGKIPVDEVFSVFTTTVYITVCFTSLILLRHREGGEYLIFMAFCMPLVSDTFAYFCGVFGGKHKLIPDVSPKKTIEGSIGGMFFCGLVCGGFALSVAKIEGFNLGVMLFVRMFIVGVIISVISQIGDLAASIIKRKMGIKDYGKIFPGHGGVMDRFDSILTVSPVILILTFIPQFVIFTA